MMTTTDLGVVFDLDGVLVDSHDQHHEAWKRLAEELGLSLSDEQFGRSFGMRNEMCIPAVFHWAQPDETERIRELGDRKEEYYRAILAEQTIEPLPGVVPLVRRLSEAGVPGSVGSSTSILNIHLCLKATGLDAFFGDRITGAEDVSRGKPAPDVFLEAARKIGKKPEHCVVIEDAHVGIDAAIAAGMKVIAVTTTHPASSFGDRPNRIVNHLGDIGVGDLLSLFLSGRAN